MGRDDTIGCSVSLGFKDHASEEMWMMIPNRMEEGRWNRIRIMIGLSIAPDPGHPQWGSSILQDSQ
jgi:hypothetical protein